MKQLIISAIAMVLVGFNAFADQYATTTLTNGVIVAANTTNTSQTAVFTATKYDTVGAHIQFQLDGAGTESIVFKFAKSMDGTNYETTPSLSKTISAAGTVTVYGVAEFANGTAGYIKLHTIENPSGQAVSNCVVKVTVKPKRSGNEE